MVKMSLCGMNRLPSGRGRHSPPGTSLSDEVSRRGAKPGGSACEQGGGLCAVLPKPGEAGLRTHRPRHGLAAFLESRPQDRAGPQGPGALPASHSEREEGRDLRRK